MTLFEYIEQHSTPENSALSAITSDTYRNVLNPHMLSGQVQGRVLSMLSCMIRPRRILELGTFTGYSALCLAEGLTDDGLLYTIDHNDELEDTVRHNLSLSPLGAKIRPLIGDALELLHEVTYTKSPTQSHLHEVLNDEPFDLVFIDADKRQYCEYLDAIYNKVRAGGFILADNTLWDGHIIDPAYDHDRQTQGLRLFNDRLAADPRFECVILPLRDGLTLIRKL